MPHLNRVAASLPAALSMLFLFAALPTAARGQASIPVIPIEGEINNMTADFVDRSLEAAREAGATILIFEMNTPGGLVSAATRITAAIKAADMQTVAWVRPEAISAGAMISVACDRIIVAPRSKIGDCAPILVGPQGMQPLGETERAKIDSYILAEFRDSATANGYPLVLSEAMVTLGPAIWRIRRIDDDTPRYVHQPELARYGLAPPDAAKPSGEPLETGWKLDRLILRENQLLTMTGDEALDYGFADATAADDAQLATQVGRSGATFLRMEPNLLERLTGFLTSPLIRGLLTIVMLMALYSEMQAPGLGLPGAVAVAAMVVLMGAPYLSGLANILEIGLILVGVALIAVELFVLPGLGIAGFAGLALVVLGLVMSFVPDEPGPGFFPTLPQGRQMLEQGVLTTFAALATAVVGFVLLGRLRHRLPVFNRFVLAAAEPEPSAAAQASAIGSTTAPANGDSGTAVAPLRPVGRAEFGGRIHDVVTRGEPIETGTPVIVVETHGNRIVVEPRPSA